MKKKRHDLAYRGRLGGAYVCMHERGDPAAVLDASPGFYGGMERSDGQFP